MISRCLSFRTPLLIAALFLGVSSSLFAQAPEPVASEPTPTVSEEPALVQQYQETILPSDLASHLYVYASDFFEGREATTRGQKLAAYYLAGQYRKIGLEPKGTVETDDPYAPEAYFQPFTVYGQRLAEARLTATRDGEAIAERTFSPTEHDDAYLVFGSAPEVQGGLVFGGYGIASDELGYNDYAALQDEGIDASGKWILALRDEPLEDDSTSLLTEDGTPSEWTEETFAKYRPAIQAGARGLLLVGDVGPRAEKSVAEQAAQAAEALGGVGSLSLDSTGSASQQYPPLYTISSDLANELLAPSSHTVEALKEQIDTNLEPTVLEVEGITIESTLRNEHYADTTENVLAYIEGTDPELKDEVIVLTSHYDHVGMNPTHEDDQIYNGADDDGSGTVTLLEMAEAFMEAKRAGYGPRRSILFMNVSAEEKGLLGSRYYADEEPVFPLDKTVTNLNIDMIGRHDPSRPQEGTNYVYIIGSKIISEDLDNILSEVNEVTDIGLELDNRFNTRDDPNQFYRRSDHWNFGKHNIPFTFFFTGTHEDYHAPGDEPHKIDYERMARISQLIFGTAWQVANQDEPPAVSGEGFN